MNDKWMKLTQKTRDLKVLYVEDDEHVRNETINMFKNLFKHIDVAIDGADGLQKYSQKENNFYDLVISDVVMPKMNGDDMMREIYAINPDQPVLMVTAYNNAEQLEKLIALGITYYLQKPIKLEPLLVKLNQLVDYIENKKEKEEEFKRIKRLNYELDSLINSFDTYVIASRTDLKGRITYASKAYEDISGYSEKELLGKPHNIVRHPDMPSSAFKDMWDTIKSEKLWVGEVKNLKKDGSYYWVEAHVAPYYDENGKHIGYSAIRLNITSQKKIEELNSKIKNLLDSAGQGFLSFDKNMKIDEGFSKECLAIFDKNNITDDNISELLFEDDKQKRDLFEDGIERIVSTEDDMTKDLFLSLLPTNHTINGKNIDIEYKLLPENMFMLILTDSTEKKKLESKIEQQNKIQSMIVAIASDKNDFINIKNDFENFISNPDPDFKIFKRKLHTFKGIFAQKNMLNITDGIHNLETLISKNSSTSHLDIFKEQYDLKSIFNKDLKIIDNILGDDFSLYEDHTDSNKEIINGIKLKIEELQRSNPQINFSTILADIKKINDVSIYEMLTPYVSSVKLISTKLNKQVNKLEIVGDKLLRVSPSIKPFVESLVHLFNNCVEHGIEDVHTRVQRGKDTIGTVQCEFLKLDNNLQIIISDDGGGIDVEKLSEVAMKNGIKSKQEIALMSTDEKSYLLFEDNLSTQDEISITSGRGVGMSAIKQEVEKLNGKIKIENKIERGVKFIFTIPLT